MDQAFHIILGDRDRARHEDPGALHEAGAHRLVVLGSGAGLTRRVAETRPDLVLTDAGVMLEELTPAAGPLERPVAMFDDRSHPGRRSGRGIAVLMVLSIARDKGSSEDEGLDVTLQAQPTRKVLLGAVLAGGIEGAQIPAGQPLASTIGHGTKATSSPSPRWT